MACEWMVMNQSLNASPWPRDVGAGVALRRVVVGYRVVSAAWLAFLGGAVLWSGAAGGTGALGGPDAAGRPAVVVATIALVVVWTAITVAVAVRRPSAFASPTWIAADVAVAVWTVVAPEVAATGGPFAGGYPFSAVVLAAVNRGFTGGLAAASVLAWFATRRLLLLDSGLVAAINNAALLYLLGAAVVAWGVQVLRDGERQRLAVEAELSREREERRRAAERADTAAHLHDSVLQTLALLQRRSADPAEVVKLARRQERELRDWLGGGLGALSGPATTLRAALQGAAEEVERDHRLTVEVVVVGDAALDDGLRALAAAAKEALVNAGKHAGVDAVALYAEVDASGARVFVRDRGKGFDPTTAGTDHRGLRESIVARLDRHGGSATVRSAPGAGTEVALVLPVPEGHLRS